MKIVCDNCSTKYSIADEKVRGKIFKIKCKKCSHIIVVKGQETTGEGPPAGFDQKDTRVFDYSGFEGQKDGPAADPIWHLVIDREQVGPLTVAELAQKWTAGEVDTDTYAWREGFDDWKRLGAIEELAAVIRRDEPKEPPASQSENLFGGATSSATAVTGPGRADPTDLFAAAGTSSEEEAPAGDLFGGRAAPAQQPSVFASSNAPATAAPADKPLRRAPKEDQPLFSLAAAEGGGNGFGTDPVPKIEARPMTAQRNENSVLFSLNNLAALATGAADPAPPKSSVGSNFSTSGPEGSGLIDIRAMAAMTMSGGKKDDSPRTRASEDDLPVFSATSFSTPAATVLMPGHHQRGGRSNSILYVLLGIFVAAIIGLLGFIFLGGRRSPVVETSPPASTTTTPPPSGTTATPPDTALAPPASGTTTTPPPSGTTTTPPPPASGTTTTPPASASTPPPSGGPPSGNPPSQQHATTPTVPPTAPVRDTKKKPDVPPRAATTPTTPPPTTSTEPPKPAEPPPVKPSEPVAKTPAAQKCDEVACLVTPDLPCCPRRNAPGSQPKPTAAATDSSLPDKLDQADIIAGMKNVNARVMVCNDKAKGAGQFKVKVTVAPDGSVSNAQALAPLGGTPAAGCVESAVKAARFKRTKQPITFNYPYTFR